MDSVSKFRRFMWFMRGDFSDFGTGDDVRGIWGDMSREDFESLVVMLGSLRREVNELGRLIRVLVDIYGGGRGYGDNGGTEEDK